MLSATVAGRAARHRTALGSFCQSAASRARAVSGWTYLGVALSFGVCVALELRVIGQVSWGATVPSLGGDLTLIVGGLLLRSPRVDFHERVQALGERVTPVALRDTLAELLRDPGLRVLSLDADGFTDEAGRPVPAPVADRERAVTLLGRAQSPVGALVHSTALRHDRRRHAAARQAAGQALELRRLRTAAAEYQRAIHAATDTVRRQLERDLHDGAQQRLVTLAVTLGDLQTQLASTGDPSAQAIVADMAGELQATLGELRRLAEGTFPAGLATTGLRDAVEDLLERTPLVARLTGDPGDGLGDLTQRTAYFVVCEGIANALKHAHAGRISLAFAREPGWLRLRLTDDGRGAADPRGPGLRGLAERVSLAGGRFAVSSPVGGGTTLEARLPAEVPSAPPQQQAHQPRHL